MAGAAALGAGHVPSFVARVAGLVVAPRREWRAVAGEATTPRDLYLGYVAPLAAIGEAATRFDERDGSGKRAFRCMALRDDR